MVCQVTLSCLVCAEQLQNFEIFLEAGKIA
jgi:hypothetical protein